MSLLKKCSTLPLILFATLICLAGTAHATWYNTGRLSIIQLLVLDNSLEIMLEGNTNCNRVFRLHTTQKNYDVKASALLAAYYAGHRVSVNYEGNLDKCTTSLEYFKVHP